MKSGSVRVLIDANVFISYLQGGNKRYSTIGRVFDAAFEGRFSLLMPAPLIDELRRVLDRPYFTERVGASEVDRFLSDLADAAETLVPLTGTFPAVTRDAKDDFLIAYAVHYGADYLVSGDKDLLVLGDALAPLKVRSPQVFLEELDDDDPE